MKNRNLKEWAKRAGIRAVKTISQAAIAGIGAAVAMGKFSGFAFPCSYAAAATLSMRDLKSPGTSGVV